MLKCSTNCEEVIRVRRSQKRVMMKLDEVTSNEFACFTMRQEGEIALKEKRRRANISFSHSRLRGLGLWRRKLCWRGLWDRDFLHFRERELMPGVCREEVRMKGIPCW